MKEKRGNADVPWTRSGEIPGPFLSRNYSVPQQGEYRGFKEVENKGIDVPGERRLHVPRSPGKHTEPRVPDCLLQGQ